MSDERTYDEKQAAAVLVTCAGCGKSWWMTLVQRLCYACRRSATPC